MMNEIVSDYQQDFSSFDNHIWLNAGSEGPLPVEAKRALIQAIEWKSKPYHLTIPKFAAVPKDLKKSIAALLSVHDRDVILGNSATYGWHILSHGFPWQDGDEIVVMQNDFPTNILPWLPLQEKGVRVIQAPPQSVILQPDELSKFLSSKTKMLCLSHVHTFSGYQLLIKDFANICHKHNILFAVNIVQSLGTMPIDVEQLGADAVVAAGYKWLCGPYGTGFCWFKPELRKQLHYHQAYWIEQLSEHELSSEGPLTYHEHHAARHYDVFGTANFFNFIPLKEAIDYWLGVGMDNVKAHHNQLGDYFIDHLNNAHYQLISPAQGAHRSSLIVFSHKDKTKNLEIFQALAQRNIHLAFWKGNMRVTPHVYNTIEDVGSLLRSLDELA